MSRVDVRALRDDERSWMRKIVRERWGDELIVGRGRAYQVGELPALVALDGDERVGLLTYRVDRAVAEIVTLDAFREGVGVGRALIQSVVGEAESAGAIRLLVMTTNDNVDALRFYQRAGFRLAKLRAGVVDEARRRKPSIPEVGHYEIPVRDELDLIRNLAAVGQDPTSSSAR
jgi:ribosomal protein S18 acetylase RimI-like enzyme